MSKEANASQPLIGRESTTVPGRFGEPLTVEHSVTSRGGFDQHAAHPLFLCLHGWGSSEEDMGTSCASSLHITISWHCAGR